MKFSKQILEAIKNGVNLALDDFENDIETLGKQKSDVIQKYDVLDQQFIKAMKNNDFGSLGPLSIKNIYKNIRHYLALINMTDEEFYIIKYMSDRDMVGYLDDIFKQIYDKYSSLFTSKYRRVMDRNALQQMILDTIKREGTECDLNWIDVSGVMDMNHLFSLRSNNEDDNWLMHNFNGNISKWDVSHVQNMEMMFYGDRAFNGDISKWDVHNVKNMGGMFWNADKFNGDISKWDVSNVEITSAMFASAKSFNQDLSNWNLSKVQKDGYMFDDCPIKEEYKPKYMQQSNIITEAVAQGIKLALDDYDNNDEYSGKNEIIGITNSLDDKILNAIKNNEFYKLSINVQKHVYKNIEYYLNLLGITMEEYYIIRYMVDHNMKDNLDKRLYQKYYNNMTLFHSKYRKITSKDELRLVIKQTIESEGPNCDLNWIDTSGITDMNSLFCTASSTVDKKIFKEFNGDISEWDVSNVEDMSYMFYGCEKFNQDISKWNVSNVKSMMAMFGVATSFNQDISKWDVSNVEDMNMMFISAKSFNQDISNWNISQKNNTPPKNIFAGCDIKEEYKPLKFQGASDEDE